MLETATNEAAISSSNMMRAQARMQSQGPRVLTRMTRSKSSASARASSPECPTPAVTVKLVGTPKRDRVRLTASSMASGSVTSQVMSWEPAMSQVAILVPWAR